MKDGFLLPEGKQSLVTDLGHQIRITLIGQPYRPANRLSAFLPGKCSPLLQ